MSAQKERNILHGKSDPRQKAIRKANGFVQCKHLPYDFTPPITAVFQYLQNGIWSVLWRKLNSLALSIVSPFFRHDFDGVQAMEAWNAILRHEVHCTLSRGSGLSTPTTALKYVLDIGSQVSSLSSIYSSDHDVLISYPFLSYRL